MLGQPTKTEALSYSAVKLLFSKYSNQCEKHTSTSQTDRQTTYCGITALCVASNGKNTKHITVPRVTMIFGEHMHREATNTISHRHLILRGKE